MSIDDHDLDLADPATVGNRRSQRVNGMSHELDYVAAVFDAAVLVTDDIGDQCRIATLAIRANRDPSTIRRPS